MAAAFNHRLDTVRRVSLHLCCLRHTRSPQSHVEILNWCLKQHRKGYPPTEQWCSLLSAYSQCPSPQRDRQVPLLPSLYTINSSGGNAAKRWKCFTHKLVSPTMWLCVGVLCLQKVVTHHNSSRLASSHNYKYKKEKFNNVCVLGVCMNPTEQPFLSSLSRLRFILILVLWHAHYFYLVL